MIFDNQYKIEQFKIKMAWNVFGFAIASIDETAITAVQRSKE